MAYDLDKACRAIESSLLIPRAMAAFSSRGALPMPLLSSQGLQQQRVLTPSQVAGGSGSSSRGQVLASTLLRIKPGRSGPVLQKR